MAKPTPSGDELAAIQSELAGNLAQKAALDESVPLQDPIIAQKQKVDDAFKALFTYYNDAVIGKYDTERKAISGAYILAPIVEADIEGVGASPPTGRLVPTPPTTDIVRVDEFDASAYTSLTTDYEQKRITDQAGIETALVTGYGGSFSGSLKTSSALTAASTTLSLNDITNPISGSVVAGTVFVVLDMSDIAVVKVITATPVGGGPPYNMNLTIELIVAPSGTILSGTSVTAFNGFNNTERTNKVASNSLYQPLMNNLISLLQGYITDRISRVNEQLAALAANEDPDGTAQITAAVTAANTSKTFLTNYLLTTVISNTGITSLSTERGVRSPYLVTRLAEIVANYTGQTEDYYEQRYQTGNNRGNTIRGTLRVLQNAKQVKITLQSLSSGLDAANDALGSIIP